MSGQNTMSDEIQSLVGEAIELALTDLSATGQLLPFVMSIKDGEKTLQRCVAETFEESEQKAREQTAIQRQGSEQVVMIFDGVVGEGTTRHEAVIAEAFEGSAGPGFRFAQLYKRSRFRKRVQPMDQVYSMGEIDD